MCPQGRGGSSPLTRTTCDLRNGKRSGDNRASFVLDHALDHARLGLSLLNRSRALQPGQQLADCWRSDGEEPESPSGARSRESPDAQSEVIGR